METTIELQLKRSISRFILFFITGLILSGITAFPLVKELWYLDNLIKDSDLYIKPWIHRVYIGLNETNLKFPYMFYGTDWLAFAHLVIAVVFIGPLRDPVKNIWVIEFGMIACCMIFPLAFICGYIRDIPMYWRLIDCSFGLIGIIPLYICYNRIKKLEKLQLNKKNNNEKK